MKKLPLAATLALALTATAAAAPTVPKLEANALDGTHVVLPAAAKGRAFVLAIGYARESQASLEAWSHALAKALPQTPLYAAAVVVGAPGILHGFITRSIRKAAPASVAQHDGQVLLTFDGTGWRQIEPPGAGENAAVVVVDAGGSVVYAVRKPESDAVLHDVVTAVRGTAAATDRTP